MSPQPAPLLLLTYKRLSSVKKTVTALQANFLAANTDLFIFSDGPKNEIDKEKVDLVRSYLESIKGFRSVVIKKAVENKGLARIATDGVTEILESYKSCIVLEDDLLTSPNFLNFMNQSLARYESNKKIFSVSGYTFPVKSPDNYKYDVYFNQRGCSWGWATWADRWASVDWTMLKNAKQKSIGETKILGTDFPSLSRKYRKGIIDTWAVPCCYYQYRNNLLTLFPLVSKVKNIGFDSEATNTFKSEKRFATILDTSLSTEFSFYKEPSLNKNLKKQFAKKFSYYERIKWRLIFDLGKLFRI